MRLLNYSIISVYRLEVIKNLSDMRGGALAHRYTKNSSMCLIFNVYIIMSGM